METMRMRQNLGALQKLITWVITLVIKETGDIVERTAPYLVSTKYAYFDREMSLEFF
jgi:hypothetical protein